MAHENSSIASPLPAIARGRGNPARHCSGRTETFWQGPPGIVDDWFEAANWTDGLPTDGDYQNIAIIDNGGVARVAAGTAKPDNFISARRSPAN